MNIDKLKTSRFENDIALACYDVEFSIKYLNTDGLENKALFHLSRIYGYLEEYVKGEKPGARYKRFLADGITVSDCKTLKKRFDIIRHIINAYKKDTSVKENRYWEIVRDNLIICSNVSWHYYSA
jgi:hypothetical protein